MNMKLIVLTITAVLTFLLGNYIAELVDLKDFLWIIASADAVLTVAYFLDALKKRHIVIGLLIAAAAICGYTAIYLIFVENPSQELMKGCLGVTIYLAILKIAILK